MRTLFRYAQVRNFCFALVFIPTLFLKAQDRVLVFEKYDDMKGSFIAKNDTVYVVNFWATWCKPCVAELPFFMEAEKAMEDKKVKITFVSLDFSDQLDKRVVPFIEKNKINSRCFLLADQDSNEWIPKVDETWSGAIPATVIYKNGDKKFFLEGSFESKNEITALVNRYL